MMELEPRNFNQSQATGRDSDERSEGERRLPQSSEVIPKKIRRKFSAKEKLRILEIADDCVKKGELGALLRREGIYSSLLAKWRVLRAQGDLGANVEKKRGRKPVPVNPLSAKLAESEKQRRKLEKKLDQAETIISFQKKFLEMFGELPKSTDDETN